MGKISDKDLSKVKFKQKESSFMAYFIRNSKVGILLSLMVVIWGLLSLQTIPKESAPYIAFGIVNVSTPYSGVSAIDVDQLITKKIENKIKNLSNLKKISSSSGEGFSSISIEYQPDTDMTRALSDLRSKIDEAKNELPNDIDSDPTITEIDSSRQPFTSIVLHGDYNPVQLRDFGEKFKDYLEDVENVANVSISGGEEREIIVEVDPSKLESFGLTLNDITNRISVTNRDFPVGDLEISDLNYNLRFVGKHAKIADLEQILLQPRVNNAPIGGETTQANTAISTPFMIELRDVATIYEAGKTGSPIRRFYVKDTPLQKDNYSDGNGGSFVEDGREFNSENAVVITLSKSAGKDVLTVAGKVKTQAIAYAEQNFPEDLKITFIQEVEPNTRDDFAMVLNNAWMAVVIVLALILIFVGLKEAVIAGMVIPLTFLLTIGILRSIGYTLSFMTNFSMILALGILVDTAIVVVEGCHDYIKKGFSSYQAAILALHEFRQPLISGTLTTLAVFIPLFTLPGVLGKYLSFIPITVFIVLVASLFISLLLITAMASLLLKPLPDKFVNFVLFNWAFRLAAFTRQVFNGFMKVIIGIYGKTLSLILNWRILRLGLMTAMILAFLGSWALFTKFELFPQGDGTSFSISVTKSTGSVKTDVLKAMTPVEKRILKLPEVIAVSSNANDTSGSIYVEILSKKERTAKGLRTSLELTNMLKEEFKAIDGAEVSVANESNGPPGGSPVAIKIIALDSNSIEAAQKTTAELKAILEQIPGTSGVTDDIDLLPGEVRYKINRSKALALKVDPSSVASLVRTSLKGTKATVITRSGKDLDVRVRYPEKYVDSLEAIDGLRVTSQTGALINVKELVDYEIKSAVSNIKRSDTKLTFTLSSGVLETGNSQQITTEFQEKIKDYQFPPGVEVELAGENQENQELFVAMGIGFSIAVLIMYMILVIQFRSYAQPFIILSTILMAFMGVNLGLYLTGTPYSLAVILGAITLAGIVVNDAIILIDQVNKKRNETLIAMSTGQSGTMELDTFELELNDTNNQPATVKLTKTELIEVVKVAAKSRFNPILLTTLTTAAGIIPLIFVDTFWAGLSYTVIFGLLVASFLTLYVTPVIYYHLDREATILFTGPLAALTGLGFIGLLLFGGSLPFGAPLVMGLQTGLGIAVIVLSLITLWMWARGRRKDRLA